MKKPKKIINNHGEGKMKEIGKKKYISPRVEEMSINMTVWGGCNSGSP